MKYTDIAEHPNFKHIVKNRNVGDNPFFHIKNDIGEYWTNYRSNSFFVPERAGRWTYSYITAFNDAKYNSGRVYLETMAGDLLLNEKNFQ